VSRVICSADFTELWEAPFESVDDINRRGQGWSEVGRIDFQPATAASAPIAAFLKRQHHYRARTVRHPIRGIATLRREYQMLGEVSAAGVGVAEPLYFAEQNDGRALLVVEALQGYVALDQWSAAQADGRARSQLVPAQRRKMLESVARLVRKVHDLGVCHGCLYPKHLFWHAGTGDIRLIDWEKARFSRRSQRSRLRDLDSLNRHAPGWSRRERVLFLAAYLGVEVGDPSLRLLWKKLLVKYRSKVSG
jgi:tRNA A-37 threonylcarbamoyl transferase component Bud32